MRRSRLAACLLLAFGCGSDPQSTPLAPDAAGAAGSGGAGSTGQPSDETPDAAVAPTPGDELGPRPETLAPPDDPSAAAGSVDAGLVPAPPVPDAGALVCPAQGNVRYSLARAMMPSADELDAYERIDAAMARALELYNCYTSISLELRVSYVPSVQTADGNVNGSLRFGARNTMNPITAMHEIGHAAGVGGPRFQPLIENGIYTGENATAMLRELTGDPSAELHGDTQHFWPYGLNYTSEVSSDEDLIRHARIVDAMQLDFR